jgi:heme-degrading monooxygenase HmoA
MSRGPAAYSLLRIPVRPGSEDAFVEAFARLRVFEHAGEAGGMRAARLLRPLGDDDTTFVVVAEWDSREAYQGWLENPLRERLRVEIEPLLAGEMSGGTFAVVRAHD